MPIQHRNRISLLQIVFPLKTLLKRLSILLMLMFAVLIIFFSKSNPNFSSAVRSKVVDISVPVQNAFSMPLDFFSAVRKKLIDAANIYYENRKLEEENVRLKKMQELSSLLASENQSLRKLLNVPHEPEVKYITGRIAGESSGPYIRSAFFTEGANAGVKKGEVVVNDEGVVGRIIEVGNNTSRVLLVTDINSRIPVMTAESKELAIAAGNNSASLQLLYLPEDIKVKPGEEVYTSGDGQFFPSGLLLGYVDSVNDKNVTMRSAVDWGKLVYVSVADYGFGDKEKDEKKE